jgi:hypothetical protein
MLCNLPGAVLPPYLSRPLLAIYFPEIYADLFDYKFTLLSKKMQINKLQNSLFDNIYCYIIFNKNLHNLQRQELVLE